jgi:hypothetical protein
MDQEKWDPLEYGQDFDFSRPFFEQFKDLKNKVPHYNLNVNPEFDLNSEYTNHASESKNCYLISQAEKNEDCYYSRGINSCKNCCDCYRIQGCELCYECIETNNSYHCLFSKNLDNCSDCYFSGELRGCRNCFGCYGLVNKEYCMFNEQLTKEEYLAKTQNMVFTREYIKQMQEYANKVEASLPHRNLHMINCENSLGDNISNCKNSYMVFDSKNLEDCRYCYEVPCGAKDAMDYCNWGEYVELVYEVSAAGYNAKNCMFSYDIWINVSDLMYCMSCMHQVRNCFGCFGLKGKEYCILNKQYSREEYEALAPRIIEHMKQTGEWGEFFPIAMSEYPYDITVAQDFYPLALKDIEKLGAKFAVDVSPASFEGNQYKIPETIDKVDTDITKQILICAETGSSYRVVKLELDFYRNLKVPVPNVCPDQRHKNRLSKRNPRKIVERNCNKCSEGMLANSYKKEEKVYCEKCYLGEMYN